MNPTEARKWGLTWHPSLVSVNLIAFQTVLTCDVINGIESNAKLSYFDRIVFLLTLLEILYPFPVLRCKLSVIVSKESWSLVVLQFFVYQWLFFVLPAVKIETHCSCTSIIGILNDFLDEQLAFNKEFIVHLCVVQLGMHNNPLIKGRLWINQSFYHWQHAWRNSIKEQEPHGFQEVAVLLLLCELCTAAVNS